MNIEPCIPPLWASTAHAQTILGYLLPSPRLRFKGQRLEIPVDGGDRLVSFLLPGTSKTLVYIFHGLAGSTDSSYMHRTAMIAQQQGHSIMLLNHRGCGEGTGLAVGPYHSGRAEDLSAAIACGRALLPNHQHLAIGFSMSGNALLLLLSGARGSIQPDAAISVNAPIELGVCSQKLSQGLNRIYDFKFYVQCRRDAIINKGSERMNIAIPRFGKIYQFDSLYTAPAGGFVSREDYYDSCSTHMRLQNIKIPTVVLTSRDDPFVPFKSYTDAKTSNSVHIHAEDFGGHMGYLSRTLTPLGSRRWQDYAIHEALKALTS